MYEDYSNLNEEPDLTPDVRFLFYRASTIDKNLVRLAVRELKETCG